MKHNQVSSAAAANPAQQNCTLHGLVHQLLPRLRFSDRTRHGLIKNHEQGTRLKKTQKIRFFNYRISQKAGRTAPTSLMYA